MGCYCVPVINPAPLVPGARSNSTPLALFRRVGLIAIALLRLIVVHLGLWLAPGCAFGLWLAFRCLDKIAFVVVILLLHNRLWLLRRIVVVAAPALLMIVLITTNVLIALIAAALISVTLLTVVPFAVPFGLAFAVLAFLFVAALVHFALRLAEQAQVMFRVLLKVFGRYAIIAQLRITRELVVFLYDLLRRAAHFALGAGAVKHAVDDVATLLRTVAVTF